MLGLVTAFVAPEASIGTGREWLVIVSVVLPVLLLLVLSYLSPKD